MFRNVPRVSLAFMAVLFGQALLLTPPMQAQDDVAMRAMKDELSRSMSQLQLQKMDKPYFLAYRLDDIDQIIVSASLGSLTMSQPSRLRLLAVEVRVGDYRVDNSNYISIRSLGGGMPGMFGGVRQAPLDDNYSQIRSGFWFATDAQYKKALEDLSAKRAALEAQNHTDDVPDFSKEPVASEFQAPAKTNASQQVLETLARHLSAVFKSMPDIFSSSVDVVSKDLYTRYVNSEGSVFTRSQPILKLQIKVETQAPDGLPISDSIEFFGRTVADLPTEINLVARTHAMADRVLKLRTATSLERYNGPVLFEGEAAPEVFSQQFAPGLMAVREPTSDDPRMGAFFDQMLSQLGGASFADKIGGRVLPNFMNVSDNPLIGDYKDAILLGSANLDDDAVKARETKLVENGILKTLLSTRVPTRAVQQSTGSRRGWGPMPSNLLVTSAKSSSENEMRKELLRVAKDRGLDFGILVRHLGGGNAASFAKMAARMAQQGGQQGSSLAEVYKLYPDGHEELVQGLEIAEMSPAMFRDIVAVGDTPFVYTDEFIPRLGALFSMGATASSDMPIVSCVAPSMLFEEVSLVKSQGPHPNLPVETSPLVKQ
jgi:predicted Zn-dependent protease